MAEAKPSEPLQNGISGMSPVLVSGESSMNGKTHPANSSQLAPEVMLRSSSVTSTHSSAASTSATTATSRRGGRIRSRSPPALSGRPMSTGPSDRKRPSSPKNPPSSAAAAAAAAAKALSNGSGGQAGWYSHDTHSRHEPSKYQYDGGSFPGARSWRRAETNDRVHAGPPRQDAYRQAGPGVYMQPTPFRGPQADAFPSNRTSSFPQQPAGGPTPSSERLSPPVAPGAYHSRQSTREDPYASPGKTDQVQEASTPVTVKRSGTSRVMGTPTPIHVPRAGDPEMAEYSVPTGSAASVFRDPPNGARVPDPATVDDESPSKILLSLRTPSHSFEDRDGPRKNNPGGESKNSLSPDGPPQIQHSHHHQPNIDIFEPKRSPNAGSLEIAPSFNLFNASFDSLGDAGQYLHATTDGSLQNNSFGMQPSGSDENTHVFSSSAIQLDGGQTIASPHHGGTLTLGMSPVNSFGNGVPSSQSRRGGNMMLVGGGDPRSSSPTQVLGMYPSYSGSGVFPQSHVHYRGPNMMNDPYARSLGSGSFGGPSMTMSHSYTRSFEQSPHSPYGMPPTMQNQTPPVDGPDGQPHFYGFLRRNKAAFIKCSFLLPGLKAALLESPLSSSKQSGSDLRKVHPMLRGRMFEPSPQDNVVASRRVVSAIFAFGGSVGGDENVIVTRESSTHSIFRDKKDKKPATVTPSSLMGTSSGNRFQSRARMKYEEMLPNRYYENENRLSWEFEESPPIEESEESRKMGRKKSRSSKRDDSRSERDSALGPTSPESSKTFLSDDASKSSLGSPGSEARGSKMRYRCKLCGQPKQNHVCAYMKSLQRSIGAMVYPAVNAFTSNEPGLLTQTLTEMNNFLPSGSESNPSSSESSPARPSSGEKRKQTGTPKRKAKNVTPETLRSSSPASVTSASRGLRTPKRLKSGGQTSGNLSGGTALSQRSTPLSTRSSGQQQGMLVSGGSDDQDLLFVDAIDLKPEQFREVSPSKAYPAPDAFTYPPLPLPYAQRKRLSDNLFALSKEVPKLTDECAVVLREAREKDMWDLAVAELMTQVVVVIHCPEHDTRLEGLRQYLLTLGIAC